MSKGLRPFQNLVNVVEKRKTIPDMIVAILLAMCPLLQHYRGFVYNAALTVMVLLIPYLLLRAVPKLKELSASNLSVVLLMVIYMVYRVIDHGTSITELGQSGVLIIYFITMALGCIDVKSFCRTGVIISVLAAVVLTVQYVCFYIFRLHFQIVPTALLLPSANQWILGAQTGLAGITEKINDLYRPSAFFLEPSHVYIYMFPHLFILLFGSKEKWAKYAAIALTWGLVLCTSGMGIAAAAGAWVLYFALYNEKTGTFSLKSIIRKRNLIAIVVLLVLLVAAVMYIPTVQRTVSRIFKTGTGVTAISGRVSKALKGMESLTPLQWIIGVEDTTHGISYNMPGLIAAIYRHGLIGMVLSVSIYVQSIYKLKLPFALTGVVILVTSLFSAHTHSTIGMLYYSLILMWGFQEFRRKPK